MRISFVTIVALAFLTLTGCASYEYDLLTPPDVARHIDAKSEQTVDLAPLQYSMITAENRLVLRVKNPTNDPVTLSGERSYVISPDGQSHPLKGQTIAPGSFIKLILPPMRPVVDRGNPSIGLGIGFGFGSARSFRRYPYDQPWYWDEPRYSAVYDESDTLLWSWDGETVAKLQLIFQRGLDRNNSDTIRHELSFRRKKV